MHLITIKSEHKSVLKCFEFLKYDGYNITYLDLKKNGLINFNSFNNYLKKNTILISVSYVNGEIGVIQNISTISIICKLNRIILHVDCTQAIGKFRIDLNNVKIDMISLSSHKTYGPKGCGIIYIRRKSNLYFKSIIHGGGQEKDIRPGSLATCNIVGLSESLLLIKKNMFFENLKINNFKNIFFKEILKIDSIYLNGDFKYRTPYNLNISFNFIEGESLILSISNIAISTGSACSSSSLESSHVLKSLNKFIPINSSLRFTFGRFNKLSDLYFLIKLLYFNILKLKKISPFFNNNVI